MGKSVGPITSLDVLGKKKTFPCRESNHISTTLTACHTVKKVATDGNCLLSRTDKTAEGYTEQESMQILSHTFVALL
jgi:hypothetical protein